MTDNTGLIIFAIVLLILICIFRMYFGYMFFYHKKDEWLINYNADLYILYFILIIKQNNNKKSDKKNGHRRY